MLGSTVQSLNNTVIYGRRFPIIKDSALASQQWLLSSELAYKNGPFTLELKLTHESALLEKSTWIDTSLCAPSLGAYFTP